MCDVVMEILRQWMDVVEGEVEEEKVAECLWSPEDRRMLSLGDARQLLHQTHRKQDKKDSIGTSTYSYFWHKCSTSDPSPYNWQYIHVPHRIASRHDNAVSHCTGLLRWGT